MKTSYLVIPSLFVTSLAAAQPNQDNAVDKPMAPVANALEITAGGGFMQGRGNTSSNTPDIQDLAGAGGGADVSIGWRVSPSLAIGTYLTIEGYSNGDAVSKSDDVVGVSFGLKTDYHFRPGRTIDPWISSGFGMRWLTIGDATTDKLTMRGLDLVRLQAGIDYRITPSFAFAPYVGATGTLYLEKNTPMTDGYVELREREMAWTFTTGLMGRFDIR